jgi:hypothetical protein
MLTPNEWDILEVIRDFFGVLHITAFLATKAKLWKSDDARGSHGESRRRTLLNYQLDLLQGQRNRDPCGKTGYLASC